MSRAQPNGVCVECQAALAEGDRFCWLCGAAVVRSEHDAAARGFAAPATLGDTIEALWIGDKDQRAQPEREGFAEAPPLLLLSFLVFLALMGVWSQSQGLAILLAILIGPPLLVTYLKSAARTSQSQRAGITPAGNRSKLAPAPPVAPMTAAEKSATFFQGLLVMLVTVGGIVGMGAICALIALVSIITALASICGIKP